MSQEKVEVARRLFAAWNDGRVAGITPFLASDVEWHDPPFLPDAAIHRGREEVIRHLQDFERTGVIDLTFNVEDVRPAGDEVIVQVEVHGRGVRSGAPSGGLRGFYVCLWRGGLLARIRLFADGDEALKAAGLSE